MNLIGLCSQRHRISKLKLIFGESLHWISFEEACRHPQGPVGTFLGFLGLETNSFHILSSNEGRCSEFVRMQNLLNQHESCIKDGKLNPHHVHLTNFPGKPFLLQPIELELINDHLTVENKRLSELLGSSFTDQQRPTSDEPFGTRFPALVYALSVLIGLKLQRFSNSNQRLLSPQKVNQFLLNECDESDLRRASTIKNHDLLNPIIKSENSSIKSWPKAIHNLAEFFINCQ